MCELAFAQRKGAFKGGVHGKSRAVCVNVDLLDWGGRDNNGHRYGCTGAITDTTFPACKQQAGKQGSVTTQNVLQMVAEVEALNDLVQALNNRAIRVPVSFTSGHGDAFATTWLVEQLEFTALITVDPAYLSAASLRLQWPVSQVNSLTGFE